MLGIRCLMEHERWEVQTEGRVMSRNHRAAGQVEMVGIVDLDATDGNARDRPHISHPNAADSGALASGVVLLP